MLDMGFIHDIRKITGMLPEPAPDPVLLGHHAEGNLRPGRTRFSPIRSASRWPRSPRPPSASNQSVIHRGPGQQGEAAGRPAQGQRHDAHPGVHPHQARRQQGHEEPGPRAGYRRRGHPRQQVARPTASGRWPASRRARSCVLVATDIAARGIDVDGVSHVDQLRPAARAGELRAPHRPHGARRSRWRRPSPSARRKSVACCATSRRPSAPRCR